MTEKTHTQIDDIDRSMYDFRYEDADAERLDAGLTADIVREISERKDEPAWMLEHRLHSLEVFNRMDARASSEVSGNLP